MGAKSTEQSRIFTSTCSVQHVILGLCETRPDNKHFIARASQSWCVSLINSYYSPPCNLSNLPNMQPDHEWTGQSERFQYYYLYFLFIEPVKDESMINKMNRLHVKCYIHGIHIKTWVKTDHMNKNIQYRNEQIIIKNLETFFFTVVSLVHHLRTLNLTLQQIASMKYD